MNRRKCDLLARSDNVKSVNLMKQGGAKVDTGNAANGVNEGARGESKEAKTGNPSIEDVVEKLLVALLIAAVRWLFTKLPTQGDARK